MEDIVIKEEECSAKVEAIAGALVDGKVIILPAATIYGISARYDDTEALKKIYRIKRRKADMPFIILISSRLQLARLAGTPGPYGEKLIEKYWETVNPQPLTLIFKKHEDLPISLTGGTDTVAVRMAGLKSVRDIIDITGPIVSTSANISGQQAKPVNIEGIPLEIRQKVDMVVRLAGGLKGIGSTIIDISSGKPVLIREGPVSFESILKDL